ncbi:MAG TPA: hypothetical protein PK095_00545 [Myxococcota bacterium]|nr:hypothetical protein [Myxococcota bacterium]
MAHSDSVTKAIATGIVKLGPAEVDCYVLEGGIRVLAQRSILNALAGEKNGGTGFGHLGRYLARLPATYADLSVAPVLEFTPPRGGRTVKGRPTSWFIDLLRAYDEADDLDLLHTQQRHLAKAARVIIRALAGVGLDALVDEATGYQAQRAPDALQRLFARLLSNEARAWQKLWPDALVTSLCKTFRIQHDGTGFPMPLTGVVGHIYATILGTEVHNELKRLNPRGPSRNKHHQHFQPELRQLTEHDLKVVHLLSEQSANKREFWARLNAHYKGEPLQLSLTA